MKVATGSGIRALIQAGKSFRLIGPSGTAPTNQLRMGAVEISGGWLDFAIFAPRHPKNLEELLAIIDESGKYTIK